MRSSDSNNYYVATVGDRSYFPNLDEDLDVHTCIIGGGYAGLMTQLGLLQRGQREVALVESKRIAWGASGRNGGFVFSGYSLAPRDIVKSVGLNRARELYNMSVDAVNLIRGRIRAQEIACEAVEGGAIWANWFKDQSILLKEQAFMEEQMGVHWRYLGAEELAACVVSSRYSGGLFEANAFHFNPLKYAYGIVKMIGDLGGKIFEDTPALEIDTTAKIVMTKTKKIRYQNLVICGGGYLESFYEPVSRAVLPVATYIMVTEPLAENCANHLLTDAAIYDTRFAFDYYRKLLDGRLLWGGRISARAQTTAGMENTLRRDLKKVFPGLGNVRVDFLWGGLMAYSRHKMPCIGYLGSGVWYNLGFGGHGVGPTTVGGELIAAAIAEDDDRYRLFEEWGLVWNGGKLGVLAAQASYWWYQAKDRFKEHCG